MPMAARNPRWNGFGGMPMFKITKRTQGTAAETDRRKNEGFRASPLPSPHNQHQNYQTNLSWLGKANTWETEGLHPHKSNQGNGSRVGMWRCVAEKRRSKTVMGQVTRQAIRVTHYRLVQIAPWVIQIVCRFESQAKRSVNVGQPGRAISHNALSGSLLREDDNTSR